MQRRIVVALGEIRTAESVIAVRSVVGGHVDRVGGDRDRICEAHLLPPGSRFAGESGAGKQLTVGGPEVADVSTGVGAALVEAQASDVAIDVRTEFYPKLVTMDIRRGCRCRYDRVAPNAVAAGMGRERKYKSSHAHYRGQ